MYIYTTLLQYAAYHRSGGVATADGRERATLRGPHQIARPLLHGIARRFGEAIFRPRRGARLYSTRSVPALAARAVCRTTRSQPAGAAIARRRARILRNRLYMRTRGTQRRCLERTTFAHSVGTCTYKCILPRYNMDKT